jgi:hypothetical protein
LIGSYDFISPRGIGYGNHTVSLTSEVVAGVQYVAVKTGSDFNTVFQNLMTVSDLESPIGETLDFINNCEFS